MIGPAGRSFGRRRLLATVGAGTAVAVAGCLGGEEDAGDEDGDGGNEEHPYATELSHPGDEPIEFGDEDRCPVCNMIAADYPDWQAQIAHADGVGAVFDTPGCLFAYAAAPPTDEAVVGAWVTDFETGRLVEASDAFFVLVTDADAVPTETMKINPRPFASYDDAVAYLEEWGAEDLTEDDIVEFEAVDRDIAAIYRGNRLPDE
ncbi:nitrous oxide reductase accessory protein NosL [Haloterrigena alkaliphila]|uniref:Nitrous oxide reductase accessory protein NosL n=1 Tax=Haloterrigena alkaliphila TaxID=2816475 RepID=A0A8A2VAL8_9EURY|nr:nitrous oxide reductase accessory protein NosL [Haloterrigena alkaliphila]QSW98521.1 nitrous oxide reductase accessory protein NosL [Haloterrigena alkaliphila]